MHASLKFAAALRHTPSADGQSESRSLRVIVADADPTARDTFCTHLNRAGHDVLAARTGAQLIELCRSVTPDLVITDARLPDADGVELAAAVCRETPVPVVLMSASPDAAAIWAAADCHALGYLPKPVEPDVLLAAVAVAIRCFDRLRVLRDEIHQARAALEDRKVIERAKGAVMRHAGLSEDEAYRRMRRAATNSGQKLIEIARTILAAGEVFARLAAGDTPNPSHPLSVSPGVRMPL